MVTSLIAMLELQNFSQMATSTIKLKSRDKNLLMTSWVEIMTS